MKKCFKCGLEKELTQFYKHKEMSDGHLNKCKECAKKDTANNDKVFFNRTDKSYDKTEKGVIRVMYKTQIANSKRRKMDLPTYTKEEFRQWLYINNFKALYSNWVKSGYEKQIKPSVDRLDDFAPYSFDNIRLVTWKKNKKHQSDDITNANGKCGRICKAVLQLDRNNIVLAEYHSFNFARRTVGYSMEKNIKNGKPSRKDGTYWRYK